MEDHPGGTVNPDYLFNIWDHYFVIRGRFLSGRGVWIDYPKHRYHYIRSTDSKLSLSVCNDSRNDRLAWHENATIDPAEDITFHICILI